MLLLHPKKYLTGLERLLNLKGLMMADMLKMVESDFL